LIEFKKKILICNFYYCRNKYNATDVILSIKFLPPLSLKKIALISRLVKQGADKSLALPGRKKANVSVRMA